MSAFMLLIGAQASLSAYYQRIMLGDAVGAWRTCVDSVNNLIADLAQPTTEMVRVIGAVARGDLTKSMSLDGEGRPLAGEFLRTANTVNAMVEQLGNFTSEVTRVAREVGVEGKLGGQAQVRGVAGTWKDLTDSVNGMAANLTVQLRDVSKVATAVANGDLTQKMTIDAQGEILQIKVAKNRMVDQLNSFASEVTRVAREVGTEGKLGGQAQVKGVAGTWKDLTDSVNGMAANLTTQVRGIAKVVTAVANGNLKRKLTVETKGEVAELVDTINNMIDTLATFADQVTTVAREVGVEGKLGGQASVPGAAGTWKELTNNVNGMAANLTTQVRAITNVATAVTKGDLSRDIAVEASGEMETLKDNINEMIGNLKETTRINTEQDWLKTNLARFSRLLQGQRDLQTVAKMILSELAPLVSVQHGVFYLSENAGGETVLKLFASFGYHERRNLSSQFRSGQGLVGQCLLEKQRILLSSVPGDYVKISSGLGEAPPLNIVVLPVLFEGQVLAILELASFNRFSSIQLDFLDQLTESTGIVLNTIQANMRTEELLTESQTLTEELKRQQEELQQTNEELEEKANLLVRQNAEVEHKNREVEQTKLDLEEKAEQLVLTSKYKSEFLANMSHELRTPLNSLLILAQQLADNQESNLTLKQVEYSRAIHESGSDLLSLINDILDLSKIESGVVTPDLSEVSLSDLQNHVERTFRHIAQSKGIAFSIEVDPQLPQTIYSDAKRLQQVLNNFLANAFKFTERGQVDLRIYQAAEGWSSDYAILNLASTVVAFSVSDTGIGIPADKRKIIFEAFQQADGSTSRRYGGTGLGLAISREIALMLGGEISLVSTPGMGSTFTFFLPVTYMPSPKKGSRLQDGDPARGMTGALVSRKEPNAVVSYAGSLSCSVHPDSDRTGNIPGTGSKSAAPSDTGEIGAKDDRHNIKPGDMVLMIVEDDFGFARILLEVAREKGFKGIVTTRGNNVLELAREFKPSAITLDLHLSDVDGWTVLDRLKLDTSTRHIPVHIISVERERSRGLQRGALTYMEKPVDKKALYEAFDKIMTYVDHHMKDLLLVDRDEARRNSLMKLIGNGDVQITAVDTGAGAMAALRTRRFDCVVLGLKLPDMTGVQLIQKMLEDPGMHDLPIIIHPEEDLTANEKNMIDRMARHAVLKEAVSPERLLDETALFLHQVAANMPEVKRKVLERLYLADELLANKKVLIVDDDVRNIFALTSVLERCQMEVLSAENGREALDIMQKTPDVNVVLMDVMMPEMDGYETTRAIRNITGFKLLPIIALTAKAMKGDREKCIEAGASDYITKPVDIQQLLSLLRVWLYR